MERLNLDRRIVRLQSWWIASEFLRRHPDLGLIETHPAGGTDDCLEIIPWATKPTALIDLNRNGSIHALPSKTMHHTHPWERERSFADRRQLVRQLEHDAELTPPRRTPSTTGKTLTFRLTYQLLLLGLNDGPDWDVRNARIDSSGYVMSTGDVEGFPTARACSLEHRPNDPFEDPLYRFWKVFVDEHCAVIIDIDGQLHQRDRGAIDLLAKFNEFGRSVEMTAAWLRHEPTMSTI